MTAKKKPPKLRSISPAELKKILEDHKKWLESEGKQGQRADLSNANLNGEFLSKAGLRQAILRGADLILADLSEADLTGADLSGADLTGANLGGANLMGARLIGTNLGGANLSGANLERALLMKTNLIGANLSGVDLTLANLTMANLDGSNFDGASLFFTVFALTDLSKAKSLETIRHEGPSNIDNYTIYRSKYTLPEIFLRGAGLQDSIINPTPALIAALKPVQFHSCFISFSHQDKAFAERLHADLQARGVRCWFAPEDMRIGDKFRSVIEHAILVYDKLLLVLSAHSIGSPWVEKEVETAFEKEKTPGKVVLFPIRLDEAIMESNKAWAADIRRIRHIGDFCQWTDHNEYKKSFERLLRDLQAEAPA